ncbi:hypothetical protein [Sediminibacillus halophilus]|uniref:Uncharacterized protein n=1 Tax=Sediminibacillus halophilus TaxID=482461 RepID=A0A1G9TTB6_9BACI|nr:hypothetical protein [Sediminibacillus halophilus]SDM50969.1 hypothetical protein SAMN05216244_2723 [Sediminibacillus halophilus]
MIGKFSTGFFVLSIALFLMAMRDILSPYLVFNTVVIGIILGTFGLLRKEPFSKLGIWLNSFFLIFLIIMLYIPPMLLGGVTIKSK